MRPFMISGLFCIMAFSLVGCDLKRSNTLELSVSNRPTPSQTNRPTPFVPDDEDAHDIKPEEQLLTFSYLKKTTFSSCVRCHAKSSNVFEKPLLRNHAEFVRHFERVRGSILEGTMPPKNGKDRRLTSCELAMLERWTELGRPVKTDVLVHSIMECKPTEAIEPVEPEPIQPIEPIEPIEPTDLITFDYLLKTAFVSCASCHEKTKNPERKPILLTLLDYQLNLERVQKSIIEDRMPETDSGDQLLTACEKAMMNAWIAVGASEKTPIRRTELDECN